MGTTRCTNANDVDIITLKHLIVIRVGFNPVAVNQALCIFCLSGTDRHQLTVFHLIDSSRMELGNHAAPDDGKPISLHPDSFSF
jgi:hypothetical protein